MIYVGIDPGFTRAGVVGIDLLGNVRFYGTFASDSARFGSRPTHQRAESLAATIASWIDDNLLGEDTVSFVIERPIYNKNAASFEKQWRTFQSILSELALLWPEAMVLEVGPGSPKKVATGNGAAKKIDMVCASSFDGPEWDKDDQEALADAQAIARCGMELPNAERDRFPLGVYAPASTGPVVSGPESKPDPT